MTPTSKWRLVLGSLTLYGLAYWLWRISPAVVLLLAVALLYWLDLGMAKLRYYPGAPVSWKIELLRLAYVLVHVFCYWAGLRQLWTWLHP